MKRDNVILLIILGLSIVLGGSAFWGLLQLPDKIEWFQLYGLLFYIIIFACLYIFILIFIGVLACLLKKEFSRSIFSGIKWSILILTITIGFGIFSGLVKVSKTEDLMKTEWKSQQQVDSTNYVNQLDSLNAIIRSDSTNYSALVQRGLIKRRKGQFAASIDDYKKALVINPQDFNANFEMGYSLGVLGDKEQQDSFYRRAVILDTNSYFAKKHPEYLKR